MVWKPRFDPSFWKPRFDPYFLGHLPMMYWFVHIKQDLGILAVSGILLLGLLLYSDYVRLVLTGAAKSQPGRNDIDAS